MTHDQREHEARERFHSRPRLVGESHLCRGGTGYQAGPEAACATCQAYEQAGCDFRKRPRSEVLVMAAWLQSEGERWGGAPGRVLLESAQKLREVLP